MDLTDLREALEALLDSEIEHAHELAEALAAETEALRNIDHAALDLATDAKQRCIEALARLDAERSQLCHEIGVAGNRAGMEQLLAEADDHTLVARWRSLVTLLEACREANQRNGIVVTVQRRRVSDALGLLRGEAAGAMLYDDRGEVSDAGTPRVRAEI